MRRRLVIYAVTVAFLLGVLFPLLTSRVFAQFEGRPLTFNEALLFVIETVTTTGYGEQAPFQSLATTLWSGVLMAAGFMIVTVWLAGLVGAWVARHFEVLPPGRAPRGMKGHILICGAGQVGQFVAQQCESRKVRYVLLDRDRTLLTTLLGAPLQVMEGNPTHAATLRRAGVGRCKAVITTLDDPANAAVCLIARSLRSGVPVCSTVDDPDRAALLRAAGAASAISARPTVGGHLAKLAAERTPPPRSALILGHGEAGSTAATALRQAGVQVRILTLEAPPPGAHNWVQGDATRPEDLLQAGIAEVDCCLVTLQGDPSAVFATLAAKQLNPAVSVFCRAAHADTVPSLYLAGADTVLSVSEVVGAELLQQVFRPGSAR